MKFSEVKTILYNSEEITNIPDKWEESIPFVSVVKGKEMDSFLYWNTCEKLEIKLMIGIIKDTGELCVFDREKIKEIFNTRSLSFPAITINDYDEYFKAKRRYEEIYECLCLSKENYALLGSETLGLFKKIVGQELYDNLFSIIAKEFFDELSCSK